MSAYLPCEMNSTLLNYAAVKEKLLAVRGTRNCSINCGFSTRSDTPDNYCTNRILIGTRHIGFQKRKCLTSFTSYSFDIMFVLLYYILILLSLFHEYFLKY